MTVLVALRATVGLDLRATQALQSVASPAIDVLANANTLVGQATVTSGLAALLAYLTWRREPRPAWLAAGLFVAVGAVGLGLKVALTHPPPPDDLIRSFWDPLGVRISTPSGFPSGHIARVTFLAILAAALFRARIARIALAVLIGYTFWARIYIGDHWLSDAIGGLALGGAAGFAALGWIGRCRSRGVRGSRRGKAFPAARH